MVILLIIFFMFEMVCDWYWGMGECIGVKFVGGICFLKDVVKYFVMVVEIVGEEWF